MFRNYRYVYALYEEGSFTKAAEKLFISQPSLSAAIRKIENDIGAELFERKGNGVRLTDAGLAYINAARKIISAENEFERELCDIRGLESGHIVIGGSNYLSSYVLPKVINKFTSLYPKIKITLAEANSHNLLELLENEKVDIIMDNVEDSDKYVRYPLTDEEILLCVPKDDPINTGLEALRILPKQIYDQSVRLDDIPPLSHEIFENKKFICLKPGMDMYYRAEEFFKRHGIEPNIAFSVDQLNISYAMSDSGVGLSFITDTFFKYGQFREGVVLYKVENSFKRTLCLAHLKNKYRSKVLNEFIKTARETVK